MAIVQTHFLVSGRDFIRTVSDVGRYVVRDGISYSEATDPAEFGRIYTEGDKMPEYDDSATSEDYEAALNRLGVNV